MAEGVMMRPGGVDDDGEWDDAISSVSAAVDWDLMARCEIGKARANGKINLFAGIPLSWISSAATFVADELDELQSSINPVHPDRPERHRDAAEAISHATAGACEEAIYRALGVVASCSCCRCAYTAAGFLRLGFVGRDGDGPNGRIEKRNCGCREGGSTICAYVADLGVKAVA